MDASTLSSTFLKISVDQIMILILYLFLGCSMLFMAIINRKNSLIKQKKLPPGPKRLPLIGNLHQLANPIHKSIQHLSKVHGPLMSLQLGSVPTVIISSADMVRDIFKNHDIIFSGRPSLYAAKRLTYNCSDIAFAPYGQNWREMRKIATIELLSTKRVQSFSSVRKEEVDLMIDSIAKSSLSGLIDLSKLTVLLSNNVVCRVTFGRKYECGINGGSELVSLLREAQELFGGFCIADFFPWMEWTCKFNGLEDRVEKNFRELDMMFDKIIEEHLDTNRPKPENEDLVDVLLRLKKDPTRNVALSNESIKGALLDMFLAGTDTSAATIVWTMAELVRNPEVMKRVQEELRRVIKGKDRVEEKDLSELVYLKLVLKESFRMHPPAPLLVPRETTEDCNIGKYEIPAKTRVFINAASIFMDPKPWKNPSEFQPERFLNSSTDFTGQHFEFVPFGVGRRGCPGINFGVTLIELALANLLYCFNWGLPDGVTTQNINMEEAFGLTMNKKINLCLLASPFK